MIVIYFATDIITPLRMLHNIICLRVTQRFELLHRKALYKYLLSLLYNMSNDRHC